ncbi:MULTISPECIES: hypothetical protein [Proteiniphilum]|jgi:hypothetical protein|uniref:hypothetical protein n=1 Tax=Proteiniphilum TaxID=294702 RepID=UPI001EEC779C|nr:MULTISPECIES: hypothetical protein [Proteiniphilum]ULB33285.1 hypothetical protein KDN43_09595 [Proteiniphilum propionicum]
MRKSIILIYISIFNCIVTVAKDSNLIFSSSISDLNEAFKWSKNTALSYAHDGTDPVGFWYEAALPNREAFCMRDIAHQSIGGEILGLSNHNYNMMIKFAENISASKDWCTYWEINKNDKPAPVDYFNDEQFWYNLPSNFDVVQACFKLYEWTGNKEYLYNPVFINFYEKTLYDYIKVWKLETENLLTRSTHMNTELPFKEETKFNGNRGIPSYIESESGFSLAGDLVASIYAACDAYSKILTIKGDTKRAEFFRNKAQNYKSFINDKFWNNKENYFNFFWSSIEGDFIMKNTPTAGETYYVWFDALETPTKSQTTINRVLVSENNVENLSHLPLLLYRYRMPEKAYEMLYTLRNHDRKEYPEASFGLIEGITVGLMGIQPKASMNIIQTLPQLISNEQWAEISNLSIFSSLVNIRHEGNYKSIFVNNSEKNLNWRASFYGEYDKIYLNGKECSPKYAVDVMGNIYSYIDTEVKHGERQICNI